MERNIIEQNKKEAAMTDFELVMEAMKARQRAYAPYSRHSVGAALLCTDGSVFLGCNVENAAYGPSNCAERTAIFKAVSEGFYDYEKIAIVGGINGLPHLNFCAPCGVCRQVMMEFVKPKKFEVVLAEIDNADELDKISQTDVKIKVCRFDELLPMGFGPENLG